MGWYIGKRILQMVPVFFGATLLIYAMVFAMPGDPIAALAGDKQLLQSKLPHFARIITSTSHSSSSTGSTSKVYSPLTWAILSPVAP